MSCSILTAVILSLVFGIISGADPCANLDQSITVKISVNGKHCFFEVPNSKAIEAENSFGDQFFNPTVGRDECTAHRALLPQLYTCDLIYAMIDSLRKSFPDQTTAVPLGVTITAAYDTEYTADLKWDNGVEQATINWTSYLNSGVNWTMSMMPGFFDRLEAGPGKANFATVMLFQKPHGTLRMFCHKTEGQELVDQATASTCTRTTTSTSTSASTTTTATSPSPSTVPKKQHSTSSGRNEKPITIPSTVYEKEHSTSSGGSEEKPIETSTKARSSGSIVEVDYAAAMMLVIVGMIKRTHIA